MCVFGKKIELREERDVLREPGKHTAQEEERCRAMRRRTRRGIGREGRAVLRRDEKEKGKQP